MSGPSANFAKGWSMIRQIKTDEPHAVTKCLGCEHLVCDTNVGGVSVKQMEYNMRPFFEQCVDSYLTLTKKDISTLNQPRHLSWMSLKLRIPLVTIEKVF